MQHGHEISLALSSFSSLATSNSSRKSRGNSSLSRVLIDLAVSAAAALRQAQLTAAYYFYDFSIIVVWPNNSSSRLFSLSGERLEMVSVHENGTVKWRRRNMTGDAKPAPVIFHTQTKMTSTSGAAIMDVVDEDNEDGQRTHARREPQRAAIVLVIIRAPNERS